MDMKLSPFFLSIFCGLSSLTFAQEPPATQQLMHPETLQQKLDIAHRDFEIAEKMFNPWYTGPLLAPAAAIPPPGHFNIQPYLFYQTVYARYDQSGHKNSIDNIKTWNPTVGFVVGATPWFAVQGATGYAHNKQEDRHGSNWTDSSLSLNVPIIKEDPDRPGVLIAFRENFPTGKYQNLDPDKGGLDATGNGSYQTTVSLNIAKLFWHIPLHPMRARLSLQWGIPYHVKVHNFNAFGGGFETEGTVKIPNSFTADVGYEFSFNQHWVFALDILYNYSEAVKFKGCPGFNACCEPANVGGPFSEQLSLAPAFEYNITPDIGFIAGVWFTVWGKNSAAFATGIVSFSYSY